jgi:hypothetical protein
MKDDGDADGSRRRCTWSYSGRTMTLDSWRGVTICAWANCGRHGSYMLRPTGRASRIWAHGVARADMKLYRMLTRAAGSTQRQVAGAKTRLSARWSRLGAGIPTHPGWCSWPSEVGVQSLAVHPGRLRKIFWRRTGARLFPLHPPSTPAIVH